MIKLSGYKYKLKNIHGRLILHEFTKENYGLSLDKLYKINNDYKNYKFNFLTNKINALTIDKYSL